MSDLTVIYALSTLPYYAKSPAKDFKIDRFELYTAALSSLTRRRDGNKTVMHCDTRGAEYFRKVGLSDLWNELVVTIPDDLEGINPRMFWAAGKLFALKNTPCPLLMLDTDFIAWNLPILDKQVITAHREPLQQNIYPSVSHFKMKDYVFNKHLNYSAQPLNTAFLYINNDSFKQYYVHGAIRFMKSAEAVDDNLTYMVFAEQRLLAILAENHNISVDTIMEWGQQHNQKSYSHTWGAKQIMRDNPAQCERFCQKCRNRIMSEFPEWAYIINCIEKA